MHPAKFAASYALDWCIGDPEGMPHPVRLIGWSIAASERTLRNCGSGKHFELAAGAIVAMGIPAAAAFCIHAILKDAHRLHPKLGVALEIWLASTCLATRNLLDESAEVMRALEAGEMDRARMRLARIVGRDTQTLDESEICRALTETLAESLSDGIIAPLVYLTIGGVPLAMAYKAVNTLDSLIGHRDETYLYFGRIAARVDDIANYIPARISALLLWLVAAWIPGTSGSRGAKIGLGGCRGPFGRDVWGLAQPGSPQQHVITRLGGVERAQYLVVHVRDDAGSAARLVHGKGAERAGRYRDGERRARSSVISNRQHRAAGRDRRRHHRVDLGQSRCNLRRELDVGRDGAAPGRSDADRRSLDGRGQWIGRPQAVCIVGAASGDVGGQSITVNRKIRTLRDIGILQRGQGIVVPGNFTGRVAYLGNGRLCESNRGHPQSHNNCEKSLHEFEIPFIGIKSNTTTYTMGHTAHDFAYRSWGARKACFLSPGSACRAKRWLNPVSRLRSLPPPLPPSPC